MPRNVRNWWIKGRADGAAKEVTFGPRLGDGGFQMTIYQRDKGEVTLALELDGEWIDGKLVLKLDGPAVGDFRKHVTER